MRNNCKALFSKDAKKANHRKYAIFPHHKIHKLSALAIASTLFIRGMRNSFTKIINLLKKYLQI